MDLSMFPSMAVKLSVDIYLLILAYSIELCSSHDMISLITFSCFVED